MSTLIKDIKYEGYTATPSDYECPDGELSLASGVLPEEGTLKPVMPASLLALLPDGQVVAFIHATTTPMKHYILFEESTGKFYWLDASVIDDAEEYPVSAEDIESAEAEIDTLGQGHAYQSINAVGNTLMVMDGDGIHHYLWKGTYYKGLGTHIPELDMSFKLNCEMLRTDRMELNPLLIDYFRAVLERGDARYRSEVFRNAADWYLLNREYGKAAYAYFRSGHFGM